MQRLLKALLAATALLPAAALAQDEHRDQGARPDHGDMRASRPPRADGGPPHGWNHGPPPGQPGPRPEGNPGPRPQGNPGPRPEGNPSWNGQPRGGGFPNGQHPNAYGNGQPRPDGGGWTGQPRPDGGRPDQGWQDRAHRDGNWNGQPRADAGRPDRVDDRAWRARQQGWRQWQRNDNDWGDHFRGDTDFAQRSAWNRSWRSDRRYDWNGYRASNRGLYRMPRYYAPYGWDGGYRRFSSGIRLNTVLFAQDYWIADPWTYRLPPVDGPYRWVRYYNDALLVDLRYGQVVDVVYGIFW